MEPWQSEFALDEPAVHGLLQDQFPVLNVEAVRYLHQGWDNFVFVINESWIFRFPKRAERGRWIESELAVLNLLHGTSREIAIPSPAFVGKPTPRFTCPFMGYRLLPGTSGDRFPADRVDRAISAKRLGELLTRVHRVDADTAAARGVQAEDWPLETLLEETMSFRDVVMPRLPAELRPLCAPYLEGSCAVPELVAMRQCLVHGDLLDEHLLVDDAGRVCGVIDWGDSCISDPSQDFAGLYMWLGEAFMRNLLEHYDVPSNGAFIEQITFRARCLALTSFGWSVKGRATTAADRLGMLQQVFAIGRPN